MLGLRHANHHWKDMGVATIISKIVSSLGTREWDPFGNRHELLGAGYNLTIAELSMVIGTPTP